MSLLWTERIDGSAQAELIANLNTMNENLHQKIRELEKTMSESPSLTDLQSGGGEMADPKSIEGELRKARADLKIRDDKGWFESGMTLNG